MYELLKWLNIDNSIQRYMSNQAPPVNVRLEYVNNILLELNARHNVEVARRSVTVELTPDGEPVDIDDLILDKDVKKLDTIREVDNEVYTAEYSPKDEEAFVREYLSGKRLNTWSFYTENGKRYLKLNSATLSDTESAEFKITYYTTNLAVDEAGNFLPRVVNTSDCFLLMPGTYQRLITTGVCKDLFLIALGTVDGQTPAAIAENRFKSELEKLGLNEDARRIKTNVRKFKIHKTI